MTIGDLMPQFLVIAYDAKDGEAMHRRSNARAAHFEQVKAMVATGQMICGGGIMAEDDERPVGSAVFVEFATRAELDGWLAREPYMVQKVWDRVEIKTVKLAINAGKLLV
jgi:uncharacterized protein YciI